MEKSEFIKNSVKRILGMMIMILVFTIGILALYFSALLVGQQETLKTTGEEFIIYLDEGGGNEETAKTDSAVFVEIDDNLRVQEIKPLTPVEGTK